MSRLNPKPQKPSNVGKRQSKPAKKEVEVTFQDETANFKIPAESFQRTDPKTAPPNLAFVNLTGSSGPTQDAGKRKLVRAHVMREFQREKQEKEQKAFELWKVQNQRDPKQLLPSVHQISDPDAFEWADAEPVENQVEVTYGSFQWRANLPYQPHIEPGVFNKQIREWKPENVGFEPNDANSEFSSPSNTIPDQPFEVPSSYDYEDEQPYEDMISEQIECPLISNSIKGITNDSASFNQIDPFNSMPGLRNSRAQAVMYHCQSNSPLTSLH
jgi:hypothetical protein